MFQCSKQQQSRTCHHSLKVFSLESFKRTNQETIDIPTLKVHNFLSLYFFFFSFLSPLFLSLFSLFLALSLSFLLTSRFSLTSHSCLSLLSYLFFLFFSLPILSTLTSYSLHSLLASFSLLILLFFFSLFSLFFSSLVLSLLSLILLSILSPSFSSCSRSLSRFFLFLPSSSHFLFLCLLHFHFVTKPQNGLLLQQLGNHVLSC